MKFFAFLFFTNSVYSRGKVFFGGGLPTEVDTDNEAKKKDLNFSL